MNEISEFKDYPLKDFLTWYKNDGLILSPKFQRNSVWNIQAKSYLIDTILKGLPIPPIFMKEYIDRNTKETIREIIDGQQRLTAIINFFNDDFAILKNHNKEFANKKYSEIGDDAQIDFLGFNIPIILVKTDDDSIVYDMFARLNTNNVVLNRQELRNSKYWGDFKVFANETATKYRNFFIKHKTFKDQQVMRMADIELINSFMIIALNNIIAESPTKVDDYYQKYDLDFDEILDVEVKIGASMAVIEQIFDTPTFKTKFFHSKVALYTLFASIYFLIFGEDEYSSYKKYDISTLYDEDGNVDNGIIKNLAFKLEELESLLDRTKNGEIEGEAYKEFKSFLDNHRTRTTSKKERFERVDFLLRYLNI